VLETAIVDEQFKEITDTVDAVWLEEAIMKFNDCQQQIKWTNSPKIIIEITLLSIVNREKNITHPQVQTADINDADKVEWKELSKKINNLEKKISNINMNEGKEQSKPTSNQRRQSSANRQSSYKIPHEHIYKVLSTAKKDALQKMNDNWKSFLRTSKGAHAPAIATIIDSKPAAASDEGLIVAFIYEIHCSLFLDHKDMVESILEDVIGEPLKIIPIPEGAWQQVRTDYLSNHGQDEKSVEEKEQEERTSPFIEEARKIAGDDLLEVKD